MTEPDEASLTDAVDITRVGNVVVMPVSTFDDLIARLLLAEGKPRSWWKP